MKEKQKVKGHSFLKDTSLIRLNVAHVVPVFDKNIVKHGYKLSNLDSYLYLYKQRYKCTHCNHPFSCTTNEVDKACYISNNTKHSIALGSGFSIAMRDFSSYMFTAKKHSYRTQEVYYN